MRPAERQAQIKKRRREVFLRWDSAMRDVFFTKEPNARLEARMYDRLATVVERVSAYVLRYSWGEYALFAIREDGTPRYQVDICRELDLKKRAVSQAVGYLQQRGYLEDQPKLLIPVVEPKPNAKPIPPESSNQWAAFVERWKVAHPTDFTELEVARSTVKRTRKVMRSDYKKEREQAKMDVQPLTSPDQFGDPASRDYACIKDSTPSTSTPTTPHWSSGWEK
jgi:hypothetical protein